METLCIAVLGNKNLPWVVAAPLPLHARTPVGRVRVGVPCQTRTVRAPRRVAFLGLLTFVWLAVFFGLYAFFVHTAAGRGLDERIFNAAPRGHSVWFRLSGGLLGSEIVLAAAGVSLTVVLGLRRHRSRQMVVGLGSAVMSVVMAELLKHVLLSRPSAGAPAAVSNSFPSGHTVVAAAVVVAVWFVAGQRWRPTVVVVGGLVSLLVGFVTVVQQWHRPSDVVSAYALVAACACAAGAVLVRSSGRPGSPVNGRPADTPAATSEETVTPPHW